MNILSFITVPRALFLLPFLLTSCGHMGPLYLPPPEQTSQQPVTAPPQSESSQEAANG